MRSSKPRAQNARQLVKTVVRRAFALGGFDLRRIHVPTPAQLDDAERVRGFIEGRSLEAIHFGCGPVLLPAPWLNVDAGRPPNPEGRPFARLDLTARLPIADATFAYAFSEDFLEHLSQRDALIHLCEAFRVLHPGGVLRISTPSLEGVLRRHYRRSDFDGALTGADEAFDRWGHEHFFSFASLSLVAQHIGFRSVERVTYGVSAHPRLAGLDTRAQQVDLNLLVELVK